MKIVKFTAENIKKLVAVEIAPSGDIVRLTGANGAGKTSVIDAITFALGGQAAIQAKPLRRGADKGRVVLDLDDYVVRRRFWTTESGDTATDVVVEAKSGARYPKPQQLLNDFFGRISFDPLAFSRMKSDDQLKMLRGLVTIDVDTDELDRLNKRDYDERTEVNRVVKNLRAQASAIVVPEGLPAEKIDADALMDQLARASEHNTDVEMRRARREQAERDIVRLRDEADRADASVGGRVRAVEIAAADQRADIERQIADLQRRLGEVGERAAAEIVAIKTATADIATERRAEADAIAAKLASADALPDLIDAAALRADVDRANRTNAMIAQRDQRAELQAKADAEKAKADQLTVNIEARDKAKADAIAAANMPVPGLSFSSDGVLLNGLPFDQASAAEQLRTSVGIAMAANPTLRVLLVRDGSLLTPSSMRLLADMVRDKDYQLWIEEADESGTKGIVISDGAVVAINDDAASTGEQLELGAA